MFSIILPVWNRADVVERAIASVRAQTCPDYELLIIDDGSTDRTAEAVRPFIGDRVTYHRIAHAGCAAARNAGLRLARRPFIAYLDSDNTWRPEYLAVMREAIRNAPEPPDFLYAIANFHRRDANGVFRVERTLGEPFSFRKLLAGNTIDQNVVVHSRHCSDTVGGYDETLKRMIDWEFIIRATAHFKPLFVPQVLADYYYGAANAISVTEDRRAARRRVRAAARRFERPAFIMHDTVRYTWENLSDEKHDNWVRMSQRVLDKTRWRANGYPCMLQVEPASLCNLACPLCPVGRRELKRPYRNMTLPEFRGIIDDMDRWLMLVVLWDWGEPFMNPELPDMIRYATERDIRTVTSTNAHFLRDEGYVESVLRAGLSTLILAVDSLSPASYELYRRNGRLDQAMEGIRKVIALKRRTGARTLLNLRMVVMRQNEHEVPPLRRLARQLGVDRFTVKTLNPSCGSTSMDGDLVPRRRAHQRYAYVPGTLQRIRIPVDCQRVWWMANIFSNGDVVPCCYDYNAANRLGNVFETPLSRLWTAAEYRALRERVSTQRDAIPVCRDCGINFQYSASGLFSECQDFTQPVYQRLTRHWAQTLWKRPLRRVRAALLHRA